MLLIQQHLKNGVETLETLFDRFGIHSKEKNGMVIFDYDQILSSKIKDHRIVKEARGLVLEKDSWNIIAKSFDRFFNLMENSDTEKFDWNSFTSYDKEDGSLFRCVAKSTSFLNLNGTDEDILCFTRFSFADQPISSIYNKTWTEEALSALNEGQKGFIRIHSKYTFVFEFCSPYTQVIKYHPKTKLVLLSLFDNQTGEEVSFNNAVWKQCKIMFNCVQEHNFKSLDEIMNTLDTLFNNKSTDEGFVVKDKNGIRLKIKSKWYLQLHKLSGNNTISNSKNFIPIILQGDVDEVLSYFPHLKDSVDEISLSLKKDIDNLREIYYTVITKESQKDFAIYLTKEIWTPFSCIFFNLRKEFGNSFTFQQVEKAFMEEEDLIVKVYKTRGLIKGEDE